jgi:hypothetical protein
MTKLKEKVNDDKYFDTEVLCNKEYFGHFISESWNANSRNCYN